MKESTLYQRSDNYKKLMEREKGIAAATPFSHAYIYLPETGQDIIIVKIICEN